MKVEFNPKVVAGRLVGGAITVTRNGGPKIYSESTFWYHVAKELLKQGYDVIAKLMWKDGHLVSDTQHYVRSRKYTPTSFTISQTDYAIRNPYEDYNDGDSPSLVVDASMEDKAADAYLAKRKSKYKVALGKKTKRSRGSSQAGLGTVR